MMCAWYLFWVLSFSYQAGQMAEMCLCDQLPVRTLDCHTHVLPLPETSYICLDHSQLQRKLCPCNSYSRKTWKSVPDLWSIHPYIFFLLFLHCSLCCIKSEPEYMMLSCVSPYSKSWDPQNKHH